MFKSLMIVLLVLVTCIRSAEVSIINNSQNFTVSDNKRATADDVEIYLCSTNISKDTCPQGLFCDEECKFGLFPANIIKCGVDEETSSVVDCYCVMYNESRNVLQVGACIYNCGWYFREETAVNSIYRSLDSSRNICALFNRAGALCGECLPEYYPLAYSYNLSCVNCSHIGWNWGRYIMAAYLPLTLFCFFIFFFRLNAVTSHLHSVILCGQFMSMPAFLRVLLLTTSTHPKYLLFIKIAFSFYGIWNLDFFRPFYSDIRLGIGPLPTLALDYAIAVYPLLLMMPAFLRVLLLTTSTHPKYLLFIKIAFSFYGIWNLDFFRPFYSDIRLGIGPLPTLALDYAIAVYPLLLMIVIHLLMKLYDRNYRVIVFMWRPFRVFFVFFRKNWNVKSSVIDSHVTFYFLSSTKLFSVTFDLLIPTQLYELNQDGFNNTTSTVHAGDVKYFGEKHRPYAILALLMFIVFILFPITVLALYILLLSSRRS